MKAANRTSVGDHRWVASARNQSQPSNAYRLSADSGDPNLEVMTAKFEQQSQSVQAFNAESFVEPKENLASSEDEGQLYESLRVERIEHSAQRRQAAAEAPRMKPQVFSFVEAPDVDLFVEDEQLESSEGGEPGQLPMVPELSEMDDTSHLHHGPSQLGLSEKADSEAQAPE